MEQLDVEDRVENTIEWLLALLQSDYPQAQKCLEDLSTGSMCCLGVGNTVCGASTFQFDGSEKTLPFHEDAWAFGLANRGSLSNPKGDKSLYVLNDNGTTHPEIARIVLSNPDEYLSEDVIPGVLEYFCFKGE